LFNGHFCSKSHIGTSKWWPLLTSGRYSEVVVSSGLTEFNIGISYTNCVTDLD